MPKVALLVSANLTNVALLQPRDGTDDKNISYYFKLECEGCGWKSEDEAIVSINVRVRRGRNSWNLCQNCQGCGRPGHIDLLPGHGAPLSQHNSRDVRLMVFDCNGLMPTDYTFNGGWLAKTTFGPEIHLDLTNVTEYKNVVNGMEVAITDLEGKFVPFWG